MQKTIYLIPLFIIAVGCISFTPAHALSCLPTDMYITSIIGDENTVIFEAKTDDTIEAKNYTAEALSVVTAYQGYVEGKLMAYHTKDETWGYLCNSGPKGDNTTGIYVATRDHNGKYQVAQRLETDSDLLPEIQKLLKDEEVTGEITEFNKTDRINQISTTIQDLLSDIMMLLKEQMYWQGVK